MKYLIIVGLFLIMGCSHKVDIKNQKFINFKQYELGAAKDKLTNKSYQVSYRLGCASSCFETCNDSEEIFTTTPEDVNAVLDYLYRSKGTFNIKKVIRNYKTDLTIEAKDELRIEYEMALCKQRQPLLFMFEEQIYLVSYRILKKEILE